MTTFQDGPAKGHALMLKRVACFLRVTNQGATWDGLDQPFDEPQASEKLYAYELVELRGHAMVNLGRGRGGCYPIAEYRLVPQQPDDALMRQPESWHGWCAAHGYGSPPAPVPKDLPLC